MLREIVADLFHRCDCFRINLAGWSRAGAVGFDLVTSVNARECFGHLAAVGILDTDEQDSLHLLFNCVHGRWHCRGHGPLLYMSRRICSGLTHPFTVGFLIRMISESPEIRATPILPNARVRRDSVPC